MPRAIKYRWVSPNGFCSRWFKTIGGTVRSAVSFHYSNGVTVKFCTRSSLALWPDLAGAGWKIEKTRTRVK